MSSESARPSEMTAFDDILARLRHETLIEQLCTTFDGSSLRDPRLAEAADEIERLRDDAARLLTRCDAFAVDVVWRANWMTRAVNLLGEIRNELEHELTESGHLNELEQLLTDEFEDGDGE